MALTAAPQARALARSILRNTPFKPALFGVLRRNAALPERVYRHLTFDGPFRVDLGLGTGFEMQHFGHQLENDLYWAGYGNNWEATSLRLWLWLVRRADVVLDIGANTGVYALAAKAAAPSARVIAFEPVARVHHRLVHNILHNRFEIETRRAAASDRAGSATLFDRPAGHVYSAALSPALLAGSGRVVTRKVETVRIDDILRQPQMPAGSRLLAKIDTEGHEDQVLAGFGSVLADLRPTLLIEVLDRVQGARLSRRIERLDYRLFEIREGEGLIPAWNLGSAPGNYLICPAEVVEAMDLARGIGHHALGPGPDAEPLLNDREVQP